ncbi:adhesion G-protein coupled receptor D1-like isoform X3 [Dendronephthya gigantea]|uniref:adhesion G-protein coupled receptor D1-like isoform X3 n=1 Tax=Dendronephthya gigantea TaxID=151771 RepID=UPI00106C8311|nr:adhesion G-protein coupled receptor D1-like isoform X3 [Dendronephthya gigantea]
MNASLKNSSTESVLLSNIISLSISRPLKKRLNDNVVINFPINKIPTSNAKASCRFLDFGKESDISWSSEGCVVGEEKDGRTACLCNHFTNFAVLTNIEEVPLDEGHREALSWLTYVGCAISLICLLATLFIFAVIKTLVVSDHIWIHCNLIASLVLAQIVFVFGIKATEIKVVCKGVAIALQYLYTTAIFWMFVEGIHLYRKVVKVFVKSSVKKYYYIFGWGGPVIIVFISALSRFDGFGNEKTCWLSIEKGLIWAFVVPVLLVVLLNVIIIVAVIRIMLVAVDTMPQSNGQNSSIRNGVKGVIFLLPILGLTWIFGVAAVNDAAIVFQYIFTALNSFQGFFIFLFHCVLNKDVRAAIKKRRLKKTTVQRWSYESSWKSKEQKYSTQMSRSSNPCVRKIKVKASPMTSGRTTSSEK